jgi:hypothetical protein
MGFYGLLPALKPTAKYSTTTRTLILTASGKAEEATSSIGFTQHNLPGGLKFDFGGWTGPVTGKYFEYTRTSVFSIELPNPVTLSDTVRLPFPNKAPFFNCKTDSTLPGHHRLIH